MPEARYLRAATETNTIKVKGHRQAKAKDKARVLVQAQERAKGRGVVPLIRTRVLAKDKVQPDKVLVRDKALGKAQDRGREYPGRDKDKAPSPKTTIRSVKIIMDLDSLKVMAIITKISIIRARAPKTMTATPMVMNKLPDYARAARQYYILIELPL